MASSNADTTKKAMAKRVNETDNQAHAHLNTIKQSKIGKIIPTQYDRLTTKNLALLGLVVMCLIDVYMYMFCFALGGLTTTAPTVPYFPGSIPGICMAIIFVLSLAHDAFVYFANKGGLLLTFLGMRLASLVVSTMAIIAVSGNVGGFFFKLILFILYLLFTLIYTYVFSIFISEIKHSGAGGSNIGEHQAV